MSLKNTVIKPWDYCEKEILQLIKDAEDHKVACKYTINYLTKFQNADWTAFEVLGKDNHSDMMYELIKNINLDEDLALKNLSEKLWTDFLEIIFWQTKCRMYFSSDIKKELFTQISNLDFNLENCHKSYELFKKNSLNLFEESIQIIFNNLKKYSLNIRNIKNFNSEFHIPIENKASLERAILIILHDLGGFARIFGLYGDFEDGPAQMGYFESALVSYRSNKWRSMYVDTDVIQILVDPQQTVLKVSFSEEMARALNQFL